MRAGASAAGAKLAATAATLINYRLLASQLPDEEVSAFLVINGLAALGSIVAGLGTAPLLVRRIRAAVLDGDSMTAERTIRKARSLVLPAGLATSLGLFGLLVFRSVLFGTEVAAFAGFGAAWLLLALACQFYGEVARGYERFGIASLVNSLNGGVLPNLLMLPLLLILLPVAPRIETVFFGQLAGLAIAAGLGWWFSRPEGELASEAISNESRCGHSEPRGLHMLGESLPMLLSQLSSVGLPHFEMLLLGMYAAPQDVAAYGAIRRLMQPIVGAQLLVNASLPTFVVELYCKDAKDRLQRLLYNTTTTAFLPAMAVTAIIFFAPQRCLTLFNPSYAEAWLPLVLMAGANLCFVSTGACGVVLRMTGFERWALVSSLTCSAVYLLAAPTVAKEHSILGVAIVSAAVMLLRNLFAVVLVRRLVGVWCLPAFSPSIAVDSSRSLLRRLKPAKNAGSSEVISRSSSTSTKATT